ncbi:hypothetical protein [Microvirga massiliensis]|uniref:hypothetical protein n=1 Tax=Microvirga massiliensis TaxID=1033741 RepID=UPI00062BC06D|nr:hypothetical protein [Microvirga massiliensis]
MQWTGTISAAHIKIVHRLDPLLVHQNILKHVYSASQADDANAALALVRATVSTATDDAIRQSVENLGEKSDLEKFFNRWLARMDRSPVKPPIPPDDPDFLVVTTGVALHTLGRRYRNCASQKVPLVAAGAHAYIEWRHAPGTIAECRRTTDGKFLLVDVHAFKNRRPDAALAATVRRKLEERGIPALSPGEGCPRVREVLRLLGVWEFGGDLGFDHDDDEDGLAGLGEELGEAADVA